MLNSSWSSSCSSPVVPRLGQFNALFTPTSTDLDNECEEVMVFKVAQNCRDMYGDKNIKPVFMLKCTKREGHYTRN